MAPFLTGDNSGGKVRAMHVEKRTKKELQSAIHEHVEAGSAIFSDELLSYDALNQKFTHQVINHAETYVAVSTPTAWRTSGVS